MGRGQRRGLSQSSTVGGGVGFEEGGCWLDGFVGEDSSMGWARGRQWVVLLAPRREEASETELWERTVRRGDN